PRRHWRCCRPRWLRSRPAPAKAPLPPPHPRSRLQEIESCSFVPPFWTNAVNLLCPARLNDARPRPDRHPLANFFLPATLFELAATPFYTVGGEKPVAAFRRYCR